MRWLLAAVLMTVSVTTFAQPPDEGGWNFEEEEEVAATWADSSYADLRTAIRAELSRNGYPAFLEQGGLLIARLHIVE